jgi:Rieske 2Fe-2S family protein
MPSDFDPRQYSLHKAHCRIFHGLIFICLSDQSPPDFDHSYGPFSEILEFHGLGNAKIAVQRNYPNQANWKLVVENFLECYHCGPAHPEYSAVHPREQLLALGAGPGSGPKEALEQYQPILTAWEQKAKSLGHPLPSIEEGPETVNMCQLSRFPIADENTHSETRDGQRACTKLLGTIRENDKGETAISFNPVSYILATNDTVLMARFTPRSTLLTDVQLNWLVHEDAEEGIDYDPDNVAWVWDKTIQQDEKITVNNQAGVLSSRYCPGRYSEHEAMLKTFHKWYLRAIA